MHSTGWRSAHIGISIASAVCISISTAIFVSIAAAIGISATAAICIPIAIASICVAALTGTVARSGVDCDAVRLGVVDDGDGHRAAER